jgi:hypothetical protein
MFGFVLTAAIMLVSLAVMAFVAGFYARARQQQTGSAECRQKTATRLQRAQRSRSASIQSAKNDRADHGRSGHQHFNEYLALHSRSHR